MLDISDSPPIPAIAYDFRLSHCGMGLIPLLSIPSHCTMWDRMGWLSRAYYPPNMLPAVHSVPLYHVGQDGMGLSRAYYSPNMLPAVHSVPLYHVGQDGIIPGVPSPNLLSAVHSVPLYHVGQDGMRWDYPRRIIPLTCSMLFIPSHCTMWDRMGWMGLSRAYHPPCCSIIPRDSLYTVPCSLTN